MHVALAAKFVEMDEVLMREQRGHLGFFHEHLDEALVGRRARLDSLERHRSLEATRSHGPRPEEFPHSPFGDLVEEFVLSQGPEGH